MSDRLEAVEAIKRINANPPPPLDDAVIAAAAHDKGGEAWGEVHDQEDRPYNILLFGPDAELDRGMAEWLGHLAHFDPMAFNNDGLKRRFADVVTIQENFLYEGRRSLYVAERDGVPYAITWLRELQANRSDYLLIKILLEWLEQFPQENSLGGNGEPVFLDQLATIAAYKSGNGEEGRQVLPPLVHTATDHYLLTHPTAMSVVGAFSGSSPLAGEIEDAHSAGQAKHRYHNIHSGAGFLVLAAFKTLEPETDSWQAEL